MTAILIQTTPEIRDSISAKMCANCVELLDTGFSGEPVWRSIVSGPLDADKQDYLLRDSLFCGVEYGVFDMRQLHRSIVAAGPQDMRVLMIKPEGVHPVEQFALAKSYMTANVYRHKVRLITDQMITRAITRGIDEDENKTLYKLYAFDNSEGFVQNYAKWDDARFMLTFCVDAPDTLCGKLLERLRTRRLLKRVYRARSPDLPAECREAIGRLKERRNDAWRGRVQEAIAKELGAIARRSIDAGEVIIHRYELPSVRKSVQNNEGFFQVQDDDGNVETFDRASLLFRSIEDAGGEEWVEVYAPADWASAKEKKRITSEAQKAIQRVIEAECSAGKTGASDEHVHIRLRSSGPKGARREGGR